MSQQPDIENQVPHDQEIIIENKAASGAHRHAHDPKVTKITHDGDYIQFGHEKYLRSELVEAFGGSLNPGLSPPPKHNVANPAPLGLSAFALTTFVLSLINVEAKGVSIPNIVVGLAFFYGGLAQLVAGMFCVAEGTSGNFGAVALSSYGGFWGAWAALYVPAFGIKEKFATEEEFRYAVGIFLIGWFIFTFFLMVLTLKSTLAFFSVFFFLSITFLLLAISEFKGSTAVKKAGGVFGLITAFAAWYNAFAGLADASNSYVTVKALHLPDLQAKNE